MDQPDSEGPTEWTQHEVDTLHTMAKEYEYQKWFWRRAKWWLAWTMGLPASVLMVWEPAVRLWKLVKGLFVGGGG